MQTYTIEQLSPNKARTPEGYLRCDNVPLARAGTMYYLPEEIGLEADSSGVVTVDRTTDDVFRPETLMSFQGKPVTLDHPPGGVVTPDNVHQYQVGTILNPRRGEGVFGDCIVGDLLITRKNAIDAVLKDGLRQVSLGYDAEYVQVRPGRGIQRNLIGNHAALVAKGRCGPRCAVGDSDKSAALMETLNMANESTAPVPEAPKTPRVPMARASIRPVTTMDKLHRVVSRMLRTQDEDSASDLADKIEELVEEKVDAAVEESGGGSTNDKMETRLVALEGQIKTLNDSVAKLVKTKDDGDEDDEDKKKKKEDDADGKADDDDDKKKKTEDKKITKDSAALAAEYRDIVSKAESLMPGYKLPTTDANAAVTVDSLCELRRTVLAAALTNDAAAVAVEAVLGTKPDVKTLSCDSVTLGFNAAAALRANAHSKAFVAGTTRFSDVAVPNDVMTPAKLGQRHKDFWSKH